MRVRELVVCLAVTVATAGLVALLLLHHSGTSVTSSPSSVQAHDQHLVHGVELQTETKRALDFRIGYPFTFPYEEVTKPVDEVLRAEWVTGLQAHLLAMSSGFVLLVEADEKFLEVLLNWLVALQRNTNLTPEDVIIISLDPNVHSLLTQRSLPSFLLLKETVLRSDVKLPSAFSHIWLLRLVVVRLLNHWGIDVAMFDIDAVVLKDPLNLFQQFPRSDIVGQQGVYPFDLHRQWGATLCMGVVLFRSSNATETFWNVVGKVKQHTFDDQVRLNYALNALKVRWFADQHCTSLANCDIVGVTLAGLNVSLVSQNAVCRQSCSMLLRDRYTVWHQHVTRDSTTKEEMARKNRVWFLRYDWKTFSDANTKLRGQHWLKGLEDKATYH